MGGLFVVSIVALALWVLLIERMADRDRERRRVDREIARSLRVERRKQAALRGPRVLP